MWMKMICCKKAICFIENQSSEKEKQPNEIATNNNLPKEWIEPKRLSKDNIIGDIRHYVGRN